MPSSGRELEIEYRLLHRRILVPWSVESLVYEFLHLSDLASLFAVSHGGVAHIVRFLRHVRTIRCHPSHFTNAHTPQALGLLLAQRFCRHLVSVVRENDNTVSSSSWPVFMHCTDAAVVARWQQAILEHNRGSIRRLGNVLGRDAHGQHVQWDPTLQWQCSYLEHFDVRIPCQAGDGWQAFQSWPAVRRLGVLGATPSSSVRSLRFRVKCFGNVLAAIVAGQIMFVVVQSIIFTGLQLQLRALHLDAMNLAMAQALVQARLPALETLSLRTDECESSLPAHEFAEFLSYSPGLTHLDVSTHPWLHHSIFEGVCTKRCTLPKLRTLCLDTDVYEKWYIASAPELRSVSVRIKPGCVWDQVDFQGLVDMCKSARELTHIAVAPPFERMGTFAQQRLPSALLRMSAHLSPRRFLRALHQGHWPSLTHLHWCPERDGHAEVATALVAQPLAKLTMLTCSVLHTMQMWQLLALHPQLQTLRCHVREDRTGVCNEYKWHEPSSSSLTSLELTSANDELLRLHLPALKTLRLSSVHSRVASLERLLQSFPCLTHLSLIRAAVEDWTCTQPMPRLEELILSDPLESGDCPVSGDTRTPGTRFAVDVVQLFAALPNLQKLLMGRLLFLETADQAQTLRAKQCLPNLRLLDLTRCLADLRGRDLRRCQALIRVLPALRAVRLNDRSGAALKSWLECHCPQVDLQTGWNTLNKLSDNQYDWYVELMPEERFME